MFPCKELLRMRLCANVTVPVPVLGTKIARKPLDFAPETCHTLRCLLDSGWGCCWVAEVRLQEGESMENALRRFKRKVQQDDIIKEVKRHSYYLKPGEKKRAKEALARKRSRKKARKEQD